MIYLINSGYVSDDLLHMFLDKDNIESNERMKLHLALIPDNAIWYDSYGPSSCLASIGLSWWRDVVPHLNNDLCMTEYFCDEFAEKIYQGMTPDTHKFSNSLGENSEVQFCIENYPEVNLIRDKDNPYTADEICNMSFKLGTLCGFLRQHSSNGIMVFP